MKTSALPHSIVPIPVPMVRWIALIWSWCLIGLLTTHAQPWTRESLTLWLKADAGVTLDAKSGVVQWADQRSE